MSDDIRPALTPEEWGLGLGSWTKRSAFELEWGGNANGGFAVIGPGFQVDVEHPDDRHALAALALHGQPFGFTRGDVRYLLSRAEHDEENASYHGGVRCRANALRSLADRIAALLPPEETP